MVLYIFYEKYEAPIVDDTPAVSDDEQTWTAVGARAAAGAYIFVI